MGGRRMRRLRLLSLITLLFLLYSSPAQAAGQLDVVGKFFANGVEFDIATYTEGADKVAVVGIARHISVAFDSQEWGAFVNLWQKAARFDSNSWQLIGSFKETGTKDMDLLVVTAGPGVQFTIMDPLKGTLSFVLAKSDFDRFDASVRQVTEYFAQ
jgi:hypothetical protein